MEATIKFIYLLLAVIIFGSCASRPKTTATIAFDKQQGDTILPKSLHLQKGKVCLVLKTSYENELPMWLEWKTSSHSDLTPLSGGGIGTDSSSSGIVDTTVTSNILVQAALYEATRKLPPGMEFVILLKNEFMDKDGEFQESQLIEKYRPDIIIILADLIFNVNGKVNYSRTTIDTQSGSSSSSHYFGNIFIDYRAQWNIIRVKENNKQIVQKGQTHSLYEKYYDLPKELFSCAKQAGADFASLLTNK